MVSGKTLKRSTAIVVGSIVALSLVTMNVSYSSFFSVQTQSGIQTISTGSLNVTASVDKTPLENKELMPDTGKSYEKIKEENGLVSAGSPDANSNNKITLTVENDGDVDAVFGASIKRTANNVKNGEDAELSNVVIAIQHDSKWLKFGEGDDAPFYVTITDLVSENGSGSEGSYPIIYDEIGKKTSDTKTTKKYDIYFWLKDDTNENQQGKSLNLSLSVKSAPKAGQENGNTVQQVKKNSTAAVNSEGVS